MSFHSKKNSIIYAVCAILGIIFLFSPGFLMSFLPTLIGLYLIIYSVMDIKEALEKANTAEWLKGLILDGIIGGVGTVFGFLLGAVLVPEKIGEQDDEG